MAISQKPRGVRAAPGTPGTARSGQEKLAAPAPLLDPVYVVFDRFFGKNKPGGDFTVGVPIRDERHDFGLAYRKA